MSPHDHELGQGQFLNGVTFEAVSNGATPPPIRPATRPVPPTGAGVIRVLLVEPMNLLRGALSTVLSAEPDLHVAADLAGVEDTVAIARAVHPDVIVINID